MIGDFNKFVLGRQSRRLLALGLIAGGLSLTACGDDDPPKPTPTPDMGSDADNNNNETPAALTISPIMQNFGSLLVGTTSASSTFTVTNTGEAASSAVAVGIEGAASADFAVTANTCAGATIAGGATCTISVTFTPGAVGNRAASLAVSAASGGAANATLEGAGLAPGGLSITPTPHGFGTVIVGETSDSQTFTITNTGGAATAALTTTIAGEHALQFNAGSDTCAGSELAAGATCTVVVDFSPDSTGNKSALLRVAGGTGEEATSALSGSGQTAAALTLSQTTHNFGSLVVGNTSNSFTFTVTNSGQQAAAALSTNVTGDATDFSVVGNTCGATLAGGSSCTITVAFAPQTAGAKSATVQLSSNPGGDIGATVTGTGLTAGDLSLAPNTHDFGIATVGTTGDSHTFTITNGGQSATGVLTTALAGTHASNFIIVAGANGCQGITLQANQTCTVTVEFAPTNTGVRSATLTVTGVPGGTGVAQLTGQGTAVIPPAAFELDPPSHNFGSVVVGTQGMPLSFTLTNVGGQTSGLPDVDIVLNNFADFEIAANGCTTALAPGDDCQIQVRFVPTAAGTRGSTLRAQATPGTSESAVLQGVGLIAASLTPNQATLSYGSWINGSDSGTQTVTFTNNGTQVTGALATTVGDQFEVTADTCAGNTLAAAASCTVTVRFSPSTVGVHSQELRVAGTPGGNPTVGLSGTSLVEYTLTGGTGDFGEVIVVTPNPNTSAPQTFTITNAGGTGGAALNGQSTRTATVGISGQHAAQFSFTPATAVAGDCRHAASASLAPGASCSVTLVFQSAGAQGARTASLDFGLTGGITDSVALSGFALALSNNLTFNNNNVNFADFTNSVLQVPPANGQDLVGSIDSFDFVLTNNSPAQSGTLTVQIAGSQNFGITSNTCAGANLSQNQTCTIRVNFYPTAAQAYTGSISVNNEVATLATANYTGTGVTPAAFTITGDGDFGQVYASVTATRTFTITNSGQQTSALPAVTLTTPGTSTAFTINAANSTCAAQTNGLVGGATCVVEVSFVVPVTNTAAHARTLQVTGAPGGTTTLALAAQSRARFSVAPVNPALGFAFGNQRQGVATAARAFNVTNHGTTDMVNFPIVISAEGVNGGVGAGTPFSFGTNNCGSITIPPGGTAPCFSVIFNPTASINYSRSYTLNGVSMTTPPESIITTPMFTGTGISPTLGLSGQTALGTATVGTTGETRVITLSNTGTDVANLTIGAIAGSHPTDFTVTNTCGTTLAAGASCEFTATFNPTATGARTATIAISDLPLVPSFNLALSGTGIAAGGLSITPGQVTFPSTEVGKQSAAQTYTVTNNNNVVATNLAMTHVISGTVTATPHFCIGTDCATDIQDTCRTQNLNPGATCTFQVAFAPTAVGGSTKNATLTVSGGNVTSTSTVMTGLRLTSPTLNVSASPGAIASGAYTFADTAANGTRTATFTVANSGQVQTGAVTVSKVGGTNADLLTISNNTCTSILPSEDCTFDVTFNPATLQVTASTLLRVAAAGVATTTDTNLSATSVASPTLTLASTTTTGCGENVWAGDSENCFTFTVTNSGAVATGDVVVTLSGSDRFAITANSCVLNFGTTTEAATPLAPGVCNITVTYQSDAVGAASATLTVADGLLSSNLPLAANTVSALVNDAIIPAGTNPVTPAVPNAYNFGSLPSGCSWIHDIDFTNESTKSSTAFGGPLSVVLSGADANQFSYESSGCVGATLGSGSDCTVRLFFVPTSTGGKNATLTVSNSDSFTSAVTLSGTGTAPANCPLQP